MKRPGLKRARELAEQRILAGRGDKEAAERYRQLAEKNPGLAEDYMDRAVECDRLAKDKLRSRQ